MNRTELGRYAWLSVAAASFTIALKGAAWWLTDSVGLLSDALESFVNLAAALMAVAMLAVAALPPDDEHAYGYSKAEYFASGFEGTLILVAAATIALAAIERLLAPQPLAHVGVGLAATVVASGANFAVAHVLDRAGTRYRSIALQADAAHLRTDVWTSAGVVVGVAMVAATGVLWLDPLIGLAVATYIVWTGIRLLRRSVSGLLDPALPATDRQAIEAVFDEYRAQGIEFHALRTRQAAGRSFVSVHVLVPGAWTVQHGHDVLEQIEARIRALVADASLLTHLEPLEDPVSYRDTQLDRPA